MSFVCVLYVRSLRFALALSSRFYAHVLGEIVNPTKSTRTRTPHTPPCSRPQTERLAARQHNINPIAEARHSTISKQFDGTVRRIFAVTSCTHTYFLIADIPVHCTQLCRWISFRLILDGVSAELFVFNLTVRGTLCMCVCVWCSEKPHQNCLGKYLPLSRLVTRFSDTVWGAAPNAYSRERVCVCVSDI